VGVGCPTPPPAPEGGGESLTECSLLKGGKNEEL